MWNCFRRSCYCPYPCGNSYIFHKKTIIQNVVGQKSLFLLSITGLFGASQCEYIVRCLSLDKVGTACLETFDAIGPKWKKENYLCVHQQSTCAFCAETLIDNGLRKHFLSHHTSKNNILWGYQVMHFIFSYIWGKVFFFKKDWMKTGLKIGTFWCTVLW